MEAVVVAALLCSEVEKHKVKLTTKWLDRHCQHKLSIQGKTLTANSMVAYIPFDIMGRRFVFVAADTISMQPSSLGGYQIIWDDHWHSQNRN